MEWLNNRLGQIIAGVTVAGTLAGFGYEGAQTINRIDNLESNVAGFISATDIALSNTIEQLDSIENRVIIIEQQLESLDVPDIGAIEKDIVALKAHGHPQQKMPDLSGIKSDVSVLQSSITNIEQDIKELKKSDNPLAN
jgi:hypothetical protein